jgi:carbonyl reductase 1
LFSFTARNPKLGEAALEQLKKEVDTASHARVHFHQLDITDKQSCNTFAQYLKQKYGGLDVLVNNAGIAFSVRMG